MAKKVKGYKDGVIETIGWFGALLVVGGYYLNANGFISSWVVWVIGNLCVAGYSWYKKAWSTLTMSIIIAIMNIYGYYKSRLGRFNDNVYFYVSISCLGSKWFLILGTL